MVGKYELLVAEKPTSAKKIAEALADGKVTREIPKKRSRINPHYYKKRKRLQIENLPQEWRTKESDKQCR